MSVPPLTIIIHNVRSIHNVGSMFRTADAVGADAIWLVGYTPGPDTHPGKMDKTALGAQLMVPWSRAKNVGRLIQKLKKEGVVVVALERAKKSADYRTFKPTFPLALLVGNEVTGVHPATAKSCDAIIAIPMRGSKESLNVVVALGVAAYELTRKWQ